MWSYEKTGSNVFLVKRGKSVSGMFLVNYLKISIQSTVEAFFNLFFTIFYLVFNFFFERLRCKYKFIMYVKKSCNFKSKDWTSKTWNQKIIVQELYALDFWLIVLINCTVRKLTLKTIIDLKICSYILYNLIANTSLSQFDLFIINM